MADSDDKDFEDLGDEELGEYVPVVQVHSMDEAERFLQLLEDYGIPASIDEDYRPSGRRGKVGKMAVMVPETLLEEAKSFIEEAEEADDVLTEEAEGLGEEEEEEVEFV